MTLKRTFLTVVLSAGVSLALAWPSATRADDNNIVAGVLNGASGCHGYAFDSIGGQILFAEIGAVLYQSRGGASEWRRLRLRDGTHADNVSLLSCDAADNGTMHDSCGRADSTAVPNDLCLQVVDVSGD